MPEQTLSLRIDAEGGPLELDVRHFAVSAQMNRCYEVDLVAVASDAGVDLDAVIGLPATFTLRGTQVDPAAPSGVRTWSGVVSEASQVAAETSGLSTYRFRVVPQLWLLTQRTDIRIFQHLSELEVVLKVLELWGITPTVHADRSAHRRREYRTQYEETDFDFVNRLMEEAGISYYFDSSESERGKMVISDAPQRETPRSHALSFQESTLASSGLEFATAVQLVRRVAPGRVALVDHDFRRPPEVPILATAQGGQQAEQRLEMFEYRDGHFLYVQGDAGDAEDPGDGRGPARTDEREAQTLAGKRLRAFRAHARETHFTTNVFDVDVGDVVKIDGHTRTELSRDGLLVTEITMSGTATGDWQIDNLGTSAADVYRPPLRTPRPVASGVESATVVGPDRNKSHKDRHGRVFVHFHWDRDAIADEYTTCWMHVSQPWGGANYGASMMPRPGQEVIVSFFGSDPDRPVVVGRYHTTQQQPPFRYPSPDEEGGMTSWSDDGSGGQNMMKWSDRGGREMLHFRAQRDHTTQVNRNQASNIDVDQSTRVGQNRTIQVGSDETRNVDGNRLITVGQDQSTAVRSNVFLSTETGSIVTSSALGVLTHSQYTNNNATVMHQMVSGDSMIVISPDCIVIKAPQVLINPSQQQANFVATYGHTYAQGRERALQAALQRNAAANAPQAYGRQLPGQRPPPPPEPPPGPDTIVVTGRRPARQALTARPGAYQRSGH